MILKFKCIITNVSYTKESLELKIVDQFKQVGTLHLTSNECTKLSDHFKDEVMESDRSHNPQGGFSGVFVALSRILPEKQFELALEFK